MGLFGGSKPKVPRLQLKPTTLTTGYGTASYNPKTGGVGYQLDDQLAQFRDLFYNSAMGFQPTEADTQFAQGVTDYGRGLFSRASNLDVGKMASDYYDQQQSVLAPNRALEEARLGDTLFKTGRTGYGTGYQGGGYINPEQFSLLKAREQQNAELQLGSEDRARALQNQDFANAFSYMDAGNSLATQPYQQMQQLLGYGTGVEGLGMGMFDTLGNFSQLQQSWQLAKQQNDAARAAAKASGGLLGGIGSGLLSGAASAFTGGFTGGLSSLGSSAFSSLFSKPTASSETSSMLSPLTGSNYRPTGGAGIRLF